MRFRTIDLLSVSIGIFAIVFGLVSDRFFAGLIRKRPASERPLPIWFGRLWFVLFGAVAISNGIWHWF